jgi:arylsulfatase A-like enzyme
LLFAAWLAAAYWFIPWLIRGAYHGESLPVLSRVISGQAVHSVEHYLGIWKALAWKLTLGFLLASVVVWIVLRLRPQIQAHFDRLLGPAAQVLRLPTVLLLCVWGGLVAGLAEALSVGLRYAIQKPSSWKYVFEAVWMAPLAGVVIFSAVGLTIVLLGLGWRSVRSLGVTIFVLTVLGCYCLLRVLPIGLFPWAALLLSIGVGVQVVRLVGGQLQSFLAVARRSTIVMMSLIVIVAVSLPISRRLAERRTMRQLDTPMPGLPNVLLIILDTVRAHNLTLYGYERNTSPHLARLAATGATFEQAIAPSSWTLPTHASLFTGRYPFELSGNWAVSLSDRFLTLAERFTQLGYATAGFVANYYYTMEPSGLSRGFTHYDSKKMSLELILQNSWAARTITRRVYKRLGIHQTLARKDAADINTEFLHWLPTSQDRPFFVFLNYFDAHYPYLPPEPFDTKFGAGPRWGQISESSPAPDELAALVDAYDGSIAYLDEQLGRLLGTLEESGALQNTLIIISSDHGEQFGERSPDLVSHGNSLFMSSVRVPLILWNPAGGVPEGLHISNPVTLRDVPATIMDMLPITADTLFPGASLARFWNETNSATRRYSAVLSEASPWDHSPPSDPVYWGPMKSLVRDTLHYIRNGAGREELYHILTDPWEQYDLSHTEQGRRALSGFRSRLEELLLPQVIAANTEVVRDDHQSSGRTDVPAPFSTEGLPGGSR